MSGVTYVQFKGASELQIFEKLFHGNFFHSQSFCQKSAERKSPNKYFHIFALNSDPTPNKPARYLLDYGGQYNNIHEEEI